MQCRLGRSNMGKRRKKGMASLLFSLGRCTRPVRLVEGSQGVHSINELLLEKPGAFWRTRDLFALEMLLNGERRPEGDLFGKLYHPACQRRRVACPLRPVCIDVGAHLVGGEKQSVRSIEWAALVIGQIWQRRVLLVSHGRPLQHLACTAPTEANR